jgi:hypothetical protein
MSGAFTIQLTEQAMQDFSALHRRPYGLRWLAVMAVVVLVLGVLIRRDSVASGNAPPLWAHVVAVALIFAAGYVLLLGLIHVLTRLWTRRYFRQQISLHLPVAVEWDADGLMCASATDQSRRRWSDFVAWQVDDRLLAIYQSFAFANIIPITDATRAHVDGMIAALRRAGVKRRSRI